jgi:DNA-binding transcriptional MerR regulator/methylmalonyl-CoA mutase cobalamin-binding subunit
MYSISQAAARTGITVEVLRAWERRYRVVAPERTATGYRLYDEAAITRLRAMRRMVDDGWSPSVAATSLQTMDAGAIRELAASRDPVTVAEPADAGALTARFVDAAANLDGSRLESILDEMTAQGTFEQVASDYVLPALDALGDAWSTGRVSVAGEHAASHAALRRLAAALEAAGRQPGPRDRPVLVGLPPGSRHELGALAFAVAIRRAGIPVLYLGPDLPVEDWLRAARATSARAAVLGVVTRADVEPAGKVADAIREARPDAFISAGGRAASDRDDGGWLVLPADLRAGVVALAAAVDSRALRRGRSRPRATGPASPTR